MSTAHEVWAALGCVLDDFALAKAYRFRAQRADETIEQYQRELARWIALYLQNGGDVSRTLRAWSAPPVVRVRVYGSVYPRRPR